VALPQTPLPTALPKNPKQTSWLYTDFTGLLLRGGEGREGNGGQGRIRQGKMSQLGSLNPPVEEGRRKAMRKA